MARGGPSTGGSKGGGNVVPTNQPTMSDNTYRSSRLFPSGNRQPISPRSYTNIFTGPRQPTMGGRFGTLGGLGYGPNPLGSAGSRGFVAGDHTYGKGMPSRYPRPMPRPMPSYNRYGGMQGPTGLGGFLSRQPAISQRQIDPATGFPTQYQIQQNRAEADAQAERDYIAQEAEADAREAARQKEEERKRYQPGGSMSRTPSGRVDFGRAMPVDPTRSSGKGGSKGGASTVNPSRPDNVQISDVFMEGVERANEQPFSDIVQSQDYRGLPPSMTNPDQYLRAGRGGRGVSPNYTQGLPERPMFQTQGPESLMGEITQSPRYQAIQIPPPPTPLTVQQRTGFSGAMEQAGGRPNIRPAMNVGKATGGPVGLASLIGMSNGGPTVQEGDGYRGAFNVQRMPPQTEKEARAIFDYDLEMDALNSAQEYLLNRFGRASLPEGRAPRNPATYQVDGIEELIMSSKGMR